METPIVGHHYRYPSTRFVESEDNNITNMNSYFDETFNKVSKKIRLDRKSMGIELGYIECLKENEDLLVKNFHIQTIQTVETEESVDLGPCAHLEKEAYRLPSIDDIPDPCDTGSFDSFHSSGAEDVILLIKERIVIFLSRKYQFIR